MLSLELKYERTSPACTADCDTESHPESQSVSESLRDIKRTASRREAHPPDFQLIPVYYITHHAPVTLVFALTHMPPPAVIMAFSPPHSYHTSSPSKRAHIIIGPSVHTRYLGSISSERHAASGISLDAKCSG